MTKNVLTLALIVLWLPWLIWFGFGVWIGGWSMSAKHEQLDLMSRAIQRGVIDVGPFIDARLESGSSDPLDIAVNRFGINPSPPSAIVFQGLLVHGLICIGGTVVLIRAMRSPKG